MNKTALYLTVFIIRLIFPLSSPQASSDYSTNAIRDGIGYRSNLLDPGNPYAVPVQYTFRTLLSRFSVQNNAPSAPPPVDKVTPDVYYEALKNILSDPAIIDNMNPLPEDLYGYGSCESNNLGVMLEFMVAAVENIKDRSVVDFLVQARHKILFICHISDSERANFIAFNEEQLQLLQDVKEARPWVEYLRGVMNFYVEDFDKAQSHFAAIPDSATPWLAQTARYLDVRIAKTKVDALAYDCYQCSPSEQSPVFVQTLADFDAIVQNHIQSYPDSSYQPIVSGLQRYVLRLQGKNIQLSEYYEAAFVEAFGANSDFPQEAKNTLLAEMNLFYLNSPAMPKSPRVHPFLLTYELLMRGRKVSEIRTDFENIKSAYAPYIGLAAYTELLFLVGEGADKKVAATKINQKIFGPLWADASVLRARALGRLGQHQKSAQAWLDLDARALTFNGQTEVESEYVKAHKFDAFARLADARFKENLSGSTSASVFNPDKYLYGSEFSNSVEDFQNTFVPSLNLLRQGFSSFATPEESMRTLEDESLSNQIKFMAAEPLLRRFLLKEDYSGYLKLYGSMSTTLPKGMDDNLAKAYQVITPVVQRLSTNKGDAEALVDFGYFLYSNHIFSACAEETVTLWERTLGACGEDDKRVLDGVVPIDIFNRALNIYKQSDTREPGEAKALRIMILCFKSERNRENCVRNQEKSYPKKTRTFLFNQLHKRFPVEAKKTPYWY